MSFKRLETRNNEIVRIAWVLQEPSGATLHRLYSWLISCSSPVRLGANACKEAENDVWL